MQSHTCIGINFLAYNYNSEVNLGYFLSLTPIPQLFSPLVRTCNLLCHTAYLDDSSCSLLRILFSFSRTQGLCFHQLASSNRLHILRLWLSCRWHRGQGACFRYGRRWAMGWITEGDSFAWERLAAHRAEAVSENLLNSSCNITVNATEMIQRSIRGNACVSH